MNYIKPNPTLTKKYEMRNSIITNENFLNIKKDLEEIYKREYTNPYYFSYFKEYLNSLKQQGIISTYSTGEELEDDVVNGTSLKIPYVDVSNKDYHSSRIFVLIK